MMSQFKNLKLLLALPLLLTLIFCSDLMANPSGVANVVKMKGEIRFENPVTGESGVLSEGMWLPEKSLIKSEAKSFARLVFVDKSTLTVGPSSEVEIKQFPKSEAGVINLIKGKIRSEVTKNYMDMKDKDSSKLYITTKTAAMGVRGTAFQVTYNETNNTTGLITYSGSVAMNRFRETFTTKDMSAINTRDLESVVRAPEAVLVEKGQFSKTGEQDDRPMEPMKVAPAQLYQMKKDEGMEKELGGKNSERSIIPPGVQSKELVNTAQGLEQSVAKASIEPSMTGSLPLPAPAPASIPVPAPYVIVTEEMKPIIVADNGGFLPPPPLKVIPIAPPPPPPTLTADNLINKIDVINTAPIVPTLGNVKIIINLQ